HPSPPPRSPRWPARNSDLTCRRGGRRRDRRPSAEIPGYDRCLARSTSTMPRIAWEEALQRLLDDVYTFAATGPRTHAGWQKDALAVMKRKVEDPRGWITLDWDKANDQQRAEDELCYPFVPLHEEELNGRLHPVTTETAVQIGRASCRERAE